MNTYRAFSRHCPLTLKIAGLLAVVVVAAALLVSRSVSAPAAAQDIEPSVTPPLPLSPATGVDDWTTGIADHDGSIVVTTTPVTETDTGDGAETVVLFHDGITGHVLAEIPTGEDNLDLRAVSANGSQAALAKVEDGSSTLVIVSLNREATQPQVQVVTLPGRVEPEAFTTDGTSLYVIDHSAGSEPGTYRVRPLDLATGTLGDTLGPDKVTPLDIDMQGYGSRQVWSPDGTRLYTLYTRHTHLPTGEESAPHSDHQPLPAGSDGFVHVLDLAEEWAYCLDLPTEFGDGDVSDSSLAVTPDGEELVVVDAEADAAVFASTSLLEVSDVVDLSFDLTGPAHVAYDGPNQVVTGSGHTLTWIERTTGTVIGSQDLLAPIAGLTSGPPHPYAWLSTGDSVPLSLP